jgi:D-tagatose-1,6-bisphosphate aldolase subunit GatZ/KbaZ
MKQALADGSILLVESTSNQVDQNGGYTGMTPSKFVAYVKKIARETGLPESRLLLGGDHLGPNSWQKLKSDEAMANSHELIRQYVAAGYQKIHLDASMFLADDQGDRHKPLEDEIVARRAAALCVTAENTWKQLPAGSPAPVYVIGTEVPIPGGATEHEEGLSVTPAADALKTVEITRRAFLDAGAGDAWERVCGLVVQPGVEYGDDQVFDFKAPEAEELSHALDDVPGVVFEAHSTDYQLPSALLKMTQMHFCIHKVGPWLTFAWREALFALAQIEKFIVKDSPASGIVDVLESVMVDNPVYWKKYYPGTEREQFIKRKFSYSDRSRYYWPDPRLSASLSSLFGNLRKNKIPPTLISQYLPLQYHAWRRGEVSLDPEELAWFHVGEVLRVYSSACGMAG